MMLLVRPGQLGEDGRADLGSCQMVQKCCFSLDDTWSARKIDVSLHLAYPGVVMPLLSAIVDLRVLICDSDQAACARLTKCLRDNPRLVYSVNEVPSIQEALSILGAVEINAIFIDPTSMGIEQTTRFVFNARQKMPWIVFVLFVEPSKVKATPEFYAGDRQRWQHYFILSKERSEPEFVEEVFHTLHMCLSDIRLGDSTTRSRLQKEFVTQFGPPTEIQDSLAAFRNKFAHPIKTAFIMMQFGNTAAHEDIATALRVVLKGFDIVGLRADDCEFHPDLVYNVLTYIYGCDFGIAVFERINEDNYNPNVSLEVGYMMALRKPICLLKDKSLKTLQADLMGKLYRPFDPYDLRKSIGGVMKKWIADRAFPLSDRESKSDS
jgi:hypothetical protein